MFYKSGAKPVKRMLFAFLLAVILTIPVVSVAAASPLKIMLRYDDFSSSSSAKIEQVLFDAAKSVGSGVLVGVIPFLDLPYPTPKSEVERLVVELDKQKIALLKRYASQRTIDISVHGFSHKNNATGGPNSEFAGLPENTQTLLLSTAKTSLEAAVGVKVSAFTPPYNQYDAQTLKSLESTGYKLLSAGLAGPMLGNGILTYLPGVLAAQTAN